jgi:hypothetical protein
MTEADLKELGFKKTKVSAKESGDKPFYYFTYDFKTSNWPLSLISTDSDVAKEEGKWKVEIFEGNLKPFKNKAQVKRYISLIKSLEK